MTAFSFVLSLSNWYKTAIPAEHGSLIDFRQTTKIISYAEQSQNDFLCTSNDKLY